MSRSVIETSEDTIEAAAVGNLRRTPLHVHDGNRMLLLAQLQPASGIIREQKQDALHKRRGWETMKRCDLIQVSECIESQLGKLIGQFVCMTFDSLPAQLFSAVRNELTGRSGGFETQSSCESSQMSMRLRDQRQFASERQEMAHN